MLEGAAVGAAAQTPRTVTVDADKLEKIERFIERFENTGSMMPPPARK